MGESSGRSSQGWSGSLQPRRKARHPTDLTMQNAERRNQIEATKSPEAAHCFIPSKRLLKKPRSCHPERSEGSAFCLFSKGNSRCFAPLSMTYALFQPPAKSSGFILLVSAFCFVIPVPCFSQQTENPLLTPQPRTSSQAQKAPGKQKPPATDANESEAQADESPPPGDWAPALLDAILNSPNGDARDALLDAAFAAGPAIVPQLEKALQDDRTAEFAAQSLALIGGGKAIEALSRLMQDPRDLNLRRFYYGALAEFEHPDAAKLLLYVVGRGDEEQDRTVTEAAILALTVRSDPSLVAPLKETHAKLKDIVIKDDVENVLDVIQARARYLASPEGRKPGGSIEQAVRTYFIPALQVPPGSGANKSAGLSTTPTTATPSPGAHGRDARATAASPSATSTTTAAVKPAKPATPAVKVDVQGITYSPDRSRALAHVIFDNPSGTAYYDMVLQKQYGNWTLASVWLGSEVEKAVTRRMAVSGEIFLTIFRRASPSRPGMFTSDTMRS